MLIKTVGQLEQELQRRQREIAHQKKLRKKAVAQADKFHEMLQAAQNELRRAEFELKKAVAQNVKLKERNDQLEKQLEVDTWERSQRQKGKR